MHNSIIYCPKCEQCGQELPIDIKYYKQTNCNPLYNGMTLLEEKIVFKDKYKKCPNCSCEFNAVEISNSLSDLF